MLIAVIAEVLRRNSLFFEILAKQWVNQLIFKPVKFLSEWVHISTNVEMGKWRFQEFQEEIIYIYNKFLWKIFQSQRTFIFKILLNNRRFLIVNIHYPILMYHPLIKAVITFFYV